jgi:type IV secretory pathway VirB10-like protein
MRGPQLDNVPSPRVTRIRLGLIWMLLLLLAGLTAGAYIFVKQGGFQRVQSFVDRDSLTGPPWLKQQIRYPVEEHDHTSLPPVRDLNAERWALVQAELAQQRAEIAALKNRPQTPPPGTTKPTVAPAPKPKQGDMLFISHEVKPEEHPAANRYALAPGATKIPCVVETAINSDVESYVTAKVRTHIYDTATGHHLLIPQNSTILGHDQSSALLYGNERLPTISLTLALPDGRSVDLGQAPITDQQGVAGLTGTVNQHWWRLFGAVFIGGALRGGVQAVQTGAAGLGPAGQVGSGIAGTANQVAQQRAGRAMDTRPTIEVASGSLCTVLLTKPLTLQAMGE